MKKIKLFIIPLVILSVIMCLASCKPKPTPTPTPDPDPTPAPDITDTFEEFGEKHYEFITLDLTTTKNGESLNSRFTLSDELIEYKIEKLSTIFIDEDGTIVVPDEHKTVISGTAIAKDGQLVSVDGTLIELPDYGTAAVGGFDFDLENMKNFKDENGKVEFEVIDPSAFIGAPTEATDMKVNLEYTANGFKSLVVNCTVGEGSVVLNYSFGEVIE